MPSPSVSFATTALALCGALAAAASASASSSVNSTVDQACATAMNGALPTATPANFDFSGNVRRYYVAAEQVEWDYAPTGWDNWLGVPLNISPRAQYAGATQYGTKWEKALYRGYTDSSFSKYSEQPPWQGTQGPTLRAEVGDLIEILFVNKLETYYATMHSMGLGYSKVSEGATYPNNTEPGQNIVLPTADRVPPVDSGVEPGNCAVYKWMVTNADGPPVTDNGPAKVHSYHSYVAMQEDTNAGLIGPTFIYGRGQMQHVMNSYREIPLLYMVYDENDSWLSGVNAQKLGGSGSSSGSSSTTSSASQATSSCASNNGNNGNGGYGGNGQNNGPPNMHHRRQSGSSSAKFPGINTQNLWSGNVSSWQPQVINLAGSGQFQNAPSFYTMNGYIFSNNPTFEMCLNEKVIWYVNAYGSASHVFHMHGNGVSYNNGSYPAVSLNDGVGKTLYMDAVGQGLWEILCHVNNHQTLGMVANYEVFSQSQCPLPALSS